MVIVYPGGRLSASSAANLLDSFVCVIVGGEIDKTNLIINIQEKQVQGMPNVIKRGEQLQPDSYFVPARL